MTTYLKVSYKGLYKSANVILYDGINIILERYNLIRTIAN